MAKLPPPTASATEWVGGTYRVPAMITGEGEPYAPEALLWIDPVEGTVLGTTLAHSDELPGMVVDHLRETIASPAMGPPGPPARLRVATDELAGLLRAEYPDIEIVIAPTPELDAVGASLAEFIEAGSPDRGWLGEGLSAEAVGAFHEAMAALWKAAPWEVMPGENSLVSVTIESLDVRDAVAVVIGQMGESFGVLLFESVADRDRYAALGTAMQRGDMAELTSLAAEVDMPPNTGLNFDEADDVSPVRREERETHGWALADDRAWPSLVCVGPKLQVRPPMARELVLGEALARSLVLVARDEDFEAAWFDDEPVERRVRVPTHAGEIDVLLSAPVDEDEAFPARDPDAIPDRVYRLKLELERIDPDWPDREVSRTFELAGDHTLWDLHHVIQATFDWDHDHLFDFFVSGKLRDRGNRYTGTPIGDIESWEDEDERSVTDTTLDDLGLKPRRVMRYVFDDQWLVRIAISTVREGGAGDRGLPRQIASVGDAPPQYETSEDELGTIVEE